MSGRDSVPPSPRSLLGTLRTSKAAPSVAGGAGLRVVEVVDRARIWIAPYGLRMEVVKERLNERYEIALPPLRKFVERDGFTLLWADVEAWWAEAPARTAHAVAQELSLLFGASAAVVDQSGAYVFLRLSGSHVRDVLSKGCPINLHSDAFPVGSCAPTLMAHCRIHLRVEAVTAFGLLVPSSYASSFWDWLTQAAVEFGLEAVSK